MLITTRQRILILALLDGVLSVCLAFSQASASDTWLDMHDDYGDYIGQGWEYFYYGSNTAFSIGGNHTHINATVADPQGPWTFTFSASPALTNGVYPGAAHGLTYFNPSIEISGQGRSCGGYTTGDFEIVEIAFDTNNVPLSLWVKFDQSCTDTGNTVPALHGELRINAHPPIIINAPATASVVRDQNLVFGVTATSTNGGTVTLSATGVPDGATFIDNGNNTATFGWIPTWSQVGNARLTIHGVDTHGATEDHPVRLAVKPITGVNSLLLDSEPGEAIGGSQRLFYASTNGSFTTTEDVIHRGAIINFTGFNSPSYSMYFVAPTNAPLIAGLYTNVHSLQEWNSSQPGLNVSGNGYDCFFVTGSFQIKQVVYGFTNNILALWASFDQHCNGYPSLFGDIRFNADAPVTLTAPRTNDVTAGHALSFLVTATDSTSNLTVLTATGLPGGATFQDNGDNTATFAWTPNATQTGTVSVSFRAENPSGEFDTGETSITVFPPPLSQYAVRKAQFFFQKSTALPRLIPRAPYVFEAFVQSATNNEISSAALQLPSGPTQPFSIQSDGKTFDVSGTFTNQVSLDAAYPIGPYTITVTTTRGELLTLPLNLPATPFPGPPHVNNSLAAQSINAAQDFVLIWDALHSGLPADWLQLKIEDPANNQIVYMSPNADEEDRLDGTSTALTIPAYTLLPGKRYLALLDFSRITGTNMVSSPFSDGFSAFATVTEFQLTTISNLRKGAGKVKFSATKFTVNDNVGNATISLLRTGGNSLPTSVYYATSNATAHAGTDYTSVTGTLVFSNGVTSQAFAIPIAPLSGSNGTKTVTLLLSPIVKGVPHGAQKATLSILGE